MILQSFLDFALWPCTDTDAVSGMPGVYVVLARPKTSTCRRHYEVLYIGSSINLARRLRSHEVLRSHPSCQLRVHFLEGVDNYKEYEVAMIKKYSPIANVRHQTQD